MQWIKSHLPIVITSSLALVGVVLLVLGIFMSDVAAKMQEDQSALSSLRSVQPVNAQVIEQAKTQHKLNQEKLEKARKDLEKTGNHEPLVQDVFPAVDIASPAQYTFKTKFLEKQGQLLEFLNAKDQPSKADVEREADWLADRKEKAAQEAVLGVDQKKETARRSTTLPARSRGRAEYRSTKVFTAMSPEERLREDPEARVSIRRARQIYCYAGMNNLDQRPAITAPTGGLPPVEEMWYAQMSLWIQQDVLGALAQLNKREAEKLPEADRWVGRLPVKRLINIGIGGYLPPDGAAAAGSGSVSAGSSSNVFTKRGSGGDVDVIHFVLELVIDAQWMPTVIDEICKSGFYTPLNINFEALSPTTDLVGFIYGSAPVTKVRIELEGCFLRSKYSKWMPQTVVTAISEGRAGSAISPSGGERPGGGMRQPAPSGRGRQPFTGS